MRLRYIFTLALAALVFVGCGERLQLDIFANIDSAIVFSEINKQLKDGGVENDAYDLVLNLNSQERGLIKAVSYSLIDGSGEEVNYLVQTVDESGEWPSNFIFKLSTNKLASDDYKLKVTVYDNFSSDGESYSFSNASFKRVFVYSFFVGIPTGASEVVLVGLKAEDDTGVYDYDRVTAKNNSLTVTGKTTISDEILQKAGTEIVMAFIGMDESNKTINITSANLLDPSLLGESEDGEREWVYTTPEATTLPDGKYSVTLSVKYTDVDGAAKTLRNSNAFVVHIDTVAPELYWRYLYNGSSLVTNSAKEEVTDSDPIYEANWDFIKTVGGASDEAQKKEFERLSTYDSKDFSGLFPLVGQSSIYVGQNFTASDTGFEPYCAGTQKLIIRGRDLAGNICNEITRKAKVKEPHSLGLYDTFNGASDPNHQMYNSNFEVAEGILGYENSNPNDYSYGDASGSSGDASRPAGRFPGWKADDLYYRTKSDKDYNLVAQTGKNLLDPDSEVKRNLDNDKDAFWWEEGSGWKSRNFFYTINYAAGKKGFRFAKWGDLKSGWIGNKWLRATSGFLYKEVIFYQGVTYSISGECKPDSGNDGVAQTAILAVTKDLSRGDSLEGGTTTGLFKLQRVEADSARDKYHHARFPENDGVMGTTTLKVEALKTAIVKIGFGKGDSRDDVAENVRDSGGAVFDNLTVTFTFPKTTDY